MIADPLTRLLAKIDMQDSGCWNWIGSRNRKGYGHFRFEGKVHRAHRVSYILLVGPILEGLVIDHLCRNHSCVNPEHLEPVTARENALRGDTIPARQLQKTHCPKGHEYTPENTYSYRNRRDCRTCRASRVREFKMRRAAA